MKQTAVEWLEEQYYDSEGKLTRQDFEQAKEMEKEQMRSASCPYIGGWEDGEFEYWYNETFKK
jgi:hypothetical protein